MKPSSQHLYTKWLIIDGFNLIYKFENLHSLMNTSQLEEAMKGLLLKLDSYQQKSKKVLTVVFDGKKREGVNTQKEKFKRISVIYSLDKTADDVIMKMVHSSKTPADYTVISSDKQIVSYVKRKGSKVMLSEHFEKLVSAKDEERQDTIDKEADISLTQEELSFWEKIFS